ncbi:putative disease resistance protein RGA4 [Sorghum bicolor]|uniref:AAA+ ATPase domain-containing protein n=1 Tax=Sorghum bicolor TaxID=4558 RepID=A0A1Z5R8H2_SORBI|nr:putative disease resistance protein RGA4 [Sorghum bicolor]XP_021301944.1 putative disease resistance protein RGA4 [Sorghum bicolor]OQU79676.1 hypothetical protein SORBI_3008G177900 [Sorghum bicolor]|eukprot:XP_021301943.1 putative disease resistance protein RGA4 [Sorghum bicolor]
MEITISAARWAVSRALRPISDGLMESWAASSKLAPNIRALKLQLLYAQGMLDNARGRDVRSPALGQLLQELRNQAFDADDVLDELEYFRIQDELDGTYETIDADVRGLVGGLVLNARHTAGAVVSKLKLPSCSCASVVCHHRRKPKLKFDRVAMSKRMVDIVEQLKPVCAMVSTILDLELQGTIASTGISAQQGTAFNQTTRTTTPQIIEPKLYGRDDLKKDVIDGITSKYHVNDDLTVLSIVGPGGLGKTTLTQHIYEEAKSHFQVLVWVCVSQNFSASKLAQEIIKQIPKLDNENGNESAEGLIEKRLQSKRFLLVLDDMWTDHENEWKKLLAPFKKMQTKGNMAIVTTRIPKVAQMVATVGCQIRLERLSDEECMCFFQACVFDDQQTWEGNPNLHDFGCEIVKRLKGFPLAVKTVGRLLKTELNTDHWRRVLESKEWEYQANEDDIMPALKLSYNYLPFHLQQCFAHCALFPEDYEFGREELIHLWIGLGLLGPDDQNKRLEDIGLDYLSDLVNHGFFHEAKKEDGSTYYVIHDLLHDLARNVSAHECISIQGSNVWSIQIPASIHHMSIIINNSDVQDKATFENCKKGLDILGKRLKARNLRTLMLFGDHHGSFCKIFSGMFRDAKTLRVIFLSGASYDVEVLLHSFSQLVHLRYLRIKGYVLNLRSLFGSISRFYNLLVLDIKECDTFAHMEEEEICSSTRDMSNLVKIRHFLVGNNSYHCGIVEIGKLKSIQEIRRFEVNREKQGFELNQVGKLIQLQGSLEICNLEKVGGATELEELKLVHLQHLNRLILGWDRDQSDRDPKKEQDVLECLKPHNNLQQVCIRGHGGHTYPTWLCSDHSAKKLECLCLKGVAWKSLPPLLGVLLVVGEEHPNVTGQIFENLKRLELVNIATLRKWSADSPFSKLQVLTIEDCFELTELPSPHMFPNVQEIYISECEELVSVPPIPWSSSLSKAELWRVGKSIENLDYSKKEQKIRVEFKKDALDRELWNVLAFTNLSEIREFRIFGCSQVPLHHLQLLNSLNTLGISDFSSVLWPTEGENDSPFEFPVEQLQISDCGATVKELVQLISYFPNLSTLELWKCGNKQAGEAEEIEAATGEQLSMPLQLKELLQNQSSLRSLEIEAATGEQLSIPSFYCPFPTSLQSLVLEGVKDGMLTLAPLTNLTKLDLYDCGGLRSEDLWPLLAQGHLKELQIWGAHNLLDVPEPSRMCEQVLPQHSSRLQALETDGEAGGAAAVPVGGHFSSSLTELGLAWNDDLEHFTMEQSEALQMLTSLQVLRIKGYSRLQSLPEGLGGLPNLKRLEIWSCGSFRSLPKGGLPSSLVELHIWFCKTIRSLPKGTLPSSLTELHIFSCDGFRSLPKGSLPSSLKILRIRFCRAVRSLHEGSLPNSLQMLDVTKSNEKLQKQCRKLQGTIPIVKF